MSTDLAPYSAQTSELVAPAAAESSLVEWARSAREAHVVAVSLAETSFVPKVMQHKPDEVTGCILVGRELGMSPMSSLRSIDLIQGVPSMRAHALRGLLQAHGHDVWVEESTEHRAIVCGRRRGSTHVERSTWTMDRAKKAGLANKDTWRNHPTAMLVARATAEVCRLVAADVLLGMPYSTEELGDDVEPAAPPAAAGPPPVKRTAKRAAPAAPPVEPPPVPEPASSDGTRAPAEQVEAPGFDDAPPAELVKPDGPPITDGQRRAMHAGYSSVGMAGRELRLQHAARIVGRPLESSNDLTMAEASLVLDALASAGAPQDVDPGDADPDNDPADES